MLSSHHPIRFTPHALASASLLVLLVTGCEKTPSITAPSALQPSFTQSTESGEIAWFNGVLYAWKFPSGSSNNQNELVFDCFRLGVDFNSHANGPRATLYALFLPGANQHSCPDGSEAHDHILSAVLGSPGYATQWELKEAWPGPNFDPSITPIKSEAALLSAAQLSQVIILDDQFVLHAVVTGPVR